MGGTSYGEEEITVVKDRKIVRGRQREKREREKERI